MSAIAFEFEKTPDGRIEDKLLEATGTSDHTGAALIAGDEVVDYVDLAERALGFAQQLGERGLEPGDRVALFQDNSVEAVIALYGTWLAGGIAVPVHIGLRRAQVAHVLETAGCRFIVTASRRRPTLKSDDLPQVERLEVGSDRAPLQGRRATTPLEGGNAPAAILFTSGSTGRPKGILLSHNNLRSGAEIVCRYLALERSDRILSVLPFSFDYGLNQLLCAVQLRATCVLQRSQLPADICRSLVDHEISVLAGVPPLWIQLMGEMSPFPEMSFPALRLLTNSGGVFPVDLIARYRAKLPEAEIFLMYGFSEAFRSTYLPPAELSRRPDSMGQGIPGCDVFAVDESGRECAPDAVGELVHRGPTVALGYWNNPEASSRVFRTDPLDPAAGSRVAYSGDLVRRDAEGFFYFVGRRDQMFKSMGFRISPEDVEEQLRALGDISEVLVGSRPDEIAGRAVVAHVVPADPDRFDVDAFSKECRRQLPSYMVPAEVHVHSSFPRTSSGKFDRKQVLS